MQDDLKIALARIAVLESRVSNLEGQVTSVSMAQPGVAEQIQAALKAYDKGMPARLQDINRRALR